jgi:DNA-binding response OmpR family regulator
MTKVMIVEDETDLREMLDLMIRKEGYETDTAENGENFLNKIDEFKPDIVTLDVMMPGLTTREILEKLPEKDNPSHSRKIFRRGKTKTLPERNRRLRHQTI